MEQNYVTVTLSIALSSGWPNYARPQVKCTKGFVKFRHVILRSVSRQTTVRQTDTLIAILRILRSDWGWSNRITFHRISVCIILTVNCNVLRHRTLQNPCNLMWVSDSRSLSRFQIGRLESNARGSDLRAYSNKFLSSPNWIRGDRRVDFSPYSHGVKDWWTHFLSTPV